MLNATLALNTLRGRASPKVGNRRVGLNDSDVKNAGSLLGPMTRVPTPSELSRDAEMPMGKLRSAPRLSGSRRRVRTWVVVATAAFATGAAGGGVGGRGAGISAAALAGCAGASGA